MVYGKKMHEQPMLDDSVRKDLISAMRTAKNFIDEEQTEQFMIYMDLMLKWNRAYNLTSVRDPRQIIARHFLDSLSIVNYINGEQIIDIGSGAGLPGIPLAIVLPDTEFVLLDSNGKKTRFLLQVIRDMRLDNVSVVNRRVEDFLPGYRFDQIVSRAFSSIREMLLLSRHLCAPNGEFLAMKGIYPSAEMAALPPGFLLIDTIDLKVPGLEGERNLIRLKLDPKNKVDSNNKDTVDNNDTHHLSASCSKGH